MADNILALLKENNRLLNEILVILRKFDSAEYQAGEDMKQFCINVSADIFVELLENDKDFKNKIKNSFKL